MASIVIKDLSDSEEMDRKAMAAIIGGSSSLGRTGVRLFAGRGQPIQLSTNPAVELNERLKHSKSLKV